jgi:hypothetical protein
MIILKRNQNFFLLQDKIILQDKINKFIYSYELGVCSIVYTLLFHVIKLWYYEKFLREKKIKMYCTTKYKNGNKLGTLKAKEKAKFCKKNENSKKK